MSQENSSSSKELQDLKDLKNFVLDLLINSLITYKQNCCFSSNFENQGFCNLEDTFLKRNFGLNQIGFLLVLSKIQEKYQIEIPLMKNSEADRDISLKEILGYISEGSSPIKR